ncbi:hypothetical protein HMPREF1979_03089 [Actinomyces johnsonii F0542]|uniref:Uncharacterized protein n=1 Tax=Actinomyces johnsonii F0542 TaxID=1321818 RepID=U1QIE3_9ACTO|nr:hypothetical protein HMPREF1979_03089 [Actinomyces johnsonii F0542]
MLLSVEFRRRTNPVPASSSACTISAMATPGVRADSRAAEDVG